VCLLAIAVPLFVAESCFPLWQKFYALSAIEFLRRTGMLNMPVKPTISAAMAAMPHQYNQYPPLFPAWHFHWL
jgi:hypothetical protein